MNATKYIEELISTDEIKFVNEPEEIWEALDPSGNVIGEIKTTWEYHSYKAQIKTNIHKDGYMLRKKDDPNIIIIIDKYGRIKREDYDIINDDSITWLDARLW